MGGKVRDHGISLDLSGGILGVRLHVSQGSRGDHRPSRPLSRQDVRQLARWLDGEALPPHVEVWYLDLHEHERAQVEALLRGLSWVAWLALWWHASGVDPEQETARVGAAQRPTERV